MVGGLTLPLCTDIKEVKKSSAVFTNCVVKNYDVYTFCIALNELSYCNDLS